MNYKNPESFYAVCVNIENDLIKQIFKTNDKGLLRMIRIDNFNRLKLDIPAIIKVRGMEERGLGKVNMMETVEIFQVPSKGNKGGS